MQSHVSKSGGTSSKVDNIIDRNNKIALSVTGANFAFVKALEKTDMALGHSKRAAEYKGLLKQLEESKKDPSALSDSMDKVSEFASAQTSLTASKTVLSDSSKAYLQEALLYTVAGAAAESIAVKETAELLKEAKDEVVKAKSNMSFGTVSKLGNVISDLQKVASKSPKQIDLIAKLSRNLSEIAKYNNISTPSTSSVEEIKIKINKGDL